MNREHEALLLSRVVDRAESRADWDELRRGAQDDGQLWERLALALREDTKFRSAMSGALDSLDALEVPAPLTIPPAAAPKTPGTRPPKIPRGALRSAAAAVVLAAAFGAGRATLQPQPEPPKTPKQPTAAPASFLADEALQHYLEASRASGRLVEILPNVTLSTRDAADGKGLEVLFLRRVVERVVVDKAFRLGTDEHGRATTSPASLASFKPPTSL